MILSDTSPRASPTLLRLLGALRRHGRRKWRIGLVLFAALNIGYFGIQRLELLPPRTLELSALDRWAGYSPAWVWVYMFLYLPVLALGPALLASRRALDAWARGLVVVLVVSFITFVAFPVAAPRPATPEGNWIYRLIIFLDRPQNAFPSLHCALMGFNALSALRGLAVALRRTGAACACAVLLSAVVVAVVWSTLATKQHYALDAAAGLALAAAADAWAWRGARQNRF